MQMTLILLLCLTLPYDEMGSITSTTNEDSVQIGDCVFKSLLPFEDPLYNHLWRKFKIHWLGHAGLVVGAGSKSNLLDTVIIMHMESDGPEITTLRDFIDSPRRSFWGFYYLGSANSAAVRHNIVKEAVIQYDQKVKYKWLSAKGYKNPGKSFRCDGFVEYCYEKAMGHNWAPGNNGGIVQNDRSISISPLLQAYKLERKNIEIDLEQLPPCVPFYMTPTDGSSITTSVVTLTWTCEDAKNYDIYISTKKNPSSKKPYKSRSRFPACTVKNLKLGKTYYWQILARNKYGETLGPVWCFQTIKLSNKPIAILSADTDEGDGPLFVGFDASASYSQRGYDINEYYFDYGDGIHSGWLKDGYQQYCYLYKGEYEAKLRAKDEQGRISDWSDPVEIEVWKDAKVEEYNLDVDVAAGWIDTGINLNAGDILEISASGIAYAINTIDPACGPEGSGWGIAVPGQGWLGVGLPVHSLIGKINAGGAPFYIGRYYKTIISVGGNLFLANNDRVFYDNAGTWRSSPKSGVKRCDIRLHS